MLARTLTMSPKAVRETATSVPTSSPAASASSTAPTSRPRNQMYGTATISAANHSDSAASSLPDSEVAARRRA